MAGRFGSRAIDFFIRLSVIVFILQPFYHLIAETGFSKGFWNSLVTVLLGLVFIILSSAIFIIPRRIYKPFTFTLVLLLSIYKLLLIFFQQGIRFEMATYSLLIFVSLYFITRPLRKDHSF